ncbi:DUF488 domain-containing protein [Sphingopyxis flava]|uniref:Uncharacterized conserved protein YeaO, DUF488 family n=1 Tax=Sphingopyxis flava TaxID=1507287 RepID=A0A1T5CJ60_9SPHN|nr:DUF488 family protein [Sphingopyxis flava]SKB59454.1 Uncharacterized conserved protein YeaO, DUF488 family [Sphingopyxis flava]
MTPPHTIAVKRIYAPAEPGDGTRFLVDRLWPRGISKEKANIAVWLKALSPTDAMRDAFHNAAAGNDAAWDAFRSAYFAALGAGGEDIAAALAELEAARNAGPVTLLYAAKDEKRNNAVALREWLERR